MNLSQQFGKDLIQIVEQILKDLIAEFQDELRQQGHVLTGKLINSMSFRVDEFSNQIVGVIEFEDYGRFVDTGVSASRIPFSGRSGKGGTSKYIEGLIRFFKLRGLSGREAKQAAFATAMKHKREGMPTNASRRFSQNGDRKGFINKRLEKAEPRILAQFEEIAGNKLEVRVLEVFRGFDRVLG